MTLWELGSHLRSNYYFSPHIFEYAINTKDSVRSIFFQSVFANSIKKNLSSEVRTKVSQPVGPGSNLCRARYFSMISLTFVTVSNCSHGTLGRTAGF